jgi:hypothetical protein
VLAGEKLGRLVVGSQRTVARINVYVGLMEGCMHVHLGIGGCALVAPE